MKGVNYEMAVSVRAFHPLMNRAFLQNFRSLCNEVKFRGWQIRDHVQLLQVWKSGSVGPSSAWKPAPVPPQTSLPDHDQKSIQRVLLAIVLVTPPPPGFL